MGSKTEPAAGKDFTLASDHRRVLALIPANNEGRQVAAVVQGARAYLPVLVVDDGSTDDTAAKASAAGAEVLRQNPRQGKGAALLAGFNWALSHGYDAVITLDADGQHDPVEIPAFLREYEARQADLIIGRRDFVRMPIIRRTANTLGTKLFSWAVGRPVADNQSGYRLITRRLMEIMSQPIERGFEFEVEMIVYCVLNEFSLGWVPIRTIYADERSHISPLKHTYKFLQVSLRARRLIQSSRTVR